MSIAVSCGIIGCGIDYKDPDDKTQGIIFNKVNNYILPENEWIALLTFKHTGYELSKFKRR